MPVYKASALVLRRIPLGETDKVLTLFTREYGKVSAIAKGARRTTSRLAGASEPLMLVRALLADGQNLDVLTQADIRESFSEIRADFGLFLRATYACELLDKLTVDRDPSIDLFDQLLSTLYILQRARDPDAAIYAYELRMMAHAGYEPQLDGCVICERPLEPAARLAVGGFSATRGGAVCEECAQVSLEQFLPLSPVTHEWLRYLAAEDNARALADASLTPAIRLEINRVLRAHLRFRLERDVRSTAFLDAYRIGAMDSLDPIGPTAEGQPA